MRYATLTLTAATVLSANTALSASINATSELSMSHTWLINSGNVPAGIDVEDLAITLVIDTDVATMIDDPTAEETQLSNFVVGNAFSDPPIPVQNERLNFTEVDENPHFAIAGFDYNIEGEDDPDEGVFDIVRRDIDQLGFARVTMDDNPVDGSAMSSSVNERDFRFINTTDELISFNLTGEFDVELRASFDGEGGIARTSGGFGLIFEDAPGASVNYFPVAPYLSTALDSDPGASVTDLFLANSGGITGLSFGASTTAIGGGGLTEAMFSAETRYIFGISLDPGASILFQTSFFQSNSVLVEPSSDVTPVPMPASLPLLMAGLGGFAALRRKRVLSEAGAENRAC